MRVGEVRMIKGRLSLLTHGSYMGQYGVSNHWTWRTIRKDGTLGKEYNGYGVGLDTSDPIKHEVIIKVDTFDLLKKVKA